jgi:hypothetical protein
LYKNTFSTQDKIMARRYYDTTQAVYALFKNHPSLAALYVEFQISTDSIKSVAEFLSMNDAKIQTYQLQTLYSSPTPNTLEGDEANPLAGTVDNILRLPLIANLNDIYYVTNPYPGLFYRYNGFEWNVDPQSKVETTAQYLAKLNNSVGYKVWEDTTGLFIAIEDAHGNTSWEQVGSGIPNSVIVRYRDLPAIAVAGTIVQVLGEDLIDIIASLYGFVTLGMTPPWSQYQSAKGTNLMVLLTLTIYLYRYGTVDNFYETHIWDFIPEYDRVAMQAQPKIKLFMESLGRKFDDMEDKLSRLQSIYNLDECPDELLDYLGQMLGYEKEDFSLSNLSFRELLKNIIEIYKIKGTNYSFSFFFKFLGFNVNLKEFYFNRDVQNPESFPGVDENNAEFYFTTKNPIYETVWGKPAPHLDAIRPINDWANEKASLDAKGCTNSIKYMLGKEGYNGGSAMHSNPWKYFKTNLIEYRLDPFLNKLDLTSSDNDTIKKYVSFLSPTYLFTWISVNLAPWVEGISIQNNVQDILTSEIYKNMGDISNGAFVDGEIVDDYFKVWDAKLNKFVSYRYADSLTMEITNNLNLGGDDRVGTVLRRNGAVTRQAGNPKHLANTFHNGAKRLAIDGVGIWIKPYGDIDYDFIVSDLSTIINPFQGQIAVLSSTGVYYVYEDPVGTWNQVFTSEIIPAERTVQSFAILNTLVGIPNAIYKITESNTYYKFTKRNPFWNSMPSQSERYSKWSDYSSRSYPDTPLYVKPFNVQLLSNSVNFSWEAIASQNGYWMQTSRVKDFSVIAGNYLFDSNTTMNPAIFLENNTFYWRIRCKNNLDDKVWLKTELDTLVLQIQQLYLKNNSFVVANDLNILQLFTIVGNTATLKTLDAITYDRFISLCALTGNKTAWTPWSSYFNFLVNATHFPFNGQVITDSNYPYLTITTDSITQNIHSIGLNIRWDSNSKTTLYEVAISTNVNFTTTVLDKTSTNNYMFFDAKNNMTYWWRSRFTLPDGTWGNWSDSSSFTLQI